MIDINNRRYIGSKTRLLQEIRNAIPKKYLNGDFSFADIFAGTGVVAYSFANVAKRIIVNDILYSNIVAYNAFFSEEKIDKLKMEKMLETFNNVNSSNLEDNYFSKVYGGKYFSKEDARVIGWIRDSIESNKDSLNKREYYYLISSLMYAADRIANTCGHFESFLSTKPKTKGVVMQGLNIIDVKGCSIYNSDANALAKQIKADVVYLDPPYNARQYVNFYHVLENLARWEKPTVFEGNSMKFKRNNLKSGYSRPQAPLLMEDLIRSLDAKLIIVSYNNTYEAKSESSNNKISEEQLIKMLKEKGRVSVKEIKYRFFNAGKTNLNNHMEKIYICEVGK